MMGKILLTFLGLSLANVSASTDLEIRLNEIATCLWSTIDDLNDRGELNKEDDFETFLSVYKSFSEGIEHDSQQEKDDVLVGSAFGAAFFCVDDISTLPFMDIEDLIPAMVEVYRREYEGRTQ